VTDPMDCMARDDTDPHVCDFCLEVETCVVAEGDDGKKVAICEACAGHALKLFDED